MRRSSWNVRGIVSVIGFLLTRLIAAISSFYKFYVIIRRRLRSFRCVNLEICKMNNLWKVAVGAYKHGLGNVGKSLKLGTPSSMKSASAFSRTMWYMCSSRSNGENKFRVKQVTELCQCGCSGLLHTAGEKNLVEYLKSEIVEEQKSQKLTALPKTVSGFSVTADGAELEFKKKNQLETITVKMNVSQSVDSEDGPGEDGYSGEMKAKPNFDIDITRNNTTLSFCCSYVTFMDNDEKGDVYQIDELAVFDGEWKENTYSVSGDILDENLYDLFITFLHEKGITNEVMEDMAEIATYYEHSKYIDLLQGIQKFASNN